ncbi:hypothetical protein GF324_09530 [bacterium]|nr:hypothetical protein [bacterium]
MKKGSPEQREKLISKIPKQIDRMTELVQKLVKLKSLEIGDYAVGIKFLDLHGDSAKGNGDAAPSFAFQKPHQNGGGVIEERKNTSDKPDSES